MKKIAISVAAMVAVMPAAAYANEDAPLQGLNVGLAVTHDSNKVDAPGSVFSAERKGLGVTGFVGYDAILGKSVLIGAQAEIGTGGRTAGGLIAAGPAAYFVDPGITYGATARVGFLANENLAFYGRVGVRSLRASIAVTDLASKVVITRSTESGLTYGAGAEYALGSSFAVRAEYNRTNFDRGISQNKILIGGAVRF